MTAGSLERYLELTGRPTDELIAGSRLIVCENAAHGLPVHAHASYVCGYRRICGSVKRSSGDNPSSARGLTPWPLTCQHLKVPCVVLIDTVETYTLPAQPSRCSILR